MAKKKLKSKPKSVAKPSLADTINSEVLAAAYSSTPPPVFMKVCRLCESKDGPFLNIFDADKITAKKIDELMPFGVKENDDLPHKICFRCSAKLEELYEFIQKCIKTQENLRTALGKTGPFLAKTKTRVVWEQKLNKSNISNDDICDALIKKAMEGIKDIPLKDIPAEEPPVIPPSPPPKRVTRNSEPIKSEPKSEPEVNKENPVGSKSRKKGETKERPAKTTRSSASTSNNVAKEEISQTEKPNEVKTKVPTITNLSFDYEETREVKTDDTPQSKTQSKPETITEKKEDENKEEKPFNIMDYISTIKVNGVGILFQCKLCNRNFLNKKVVESHTCARNGTSKVDIPKDPPAPEPPKITNTVKYIKMDSDMKKSLSERAQKIENEKALNAETAKKQEENNQVPIAPIMPPKPKVGPASKTKRLAPAPAVVQPELNEKPVQTIPIQPVPIQPVQTHPVLTQPITPSLQFANMPNLNGRYKLVPGPNNMFTLVEESPNVPPPSEHIQKHSRKRKSDESIKSNNLIKDPKNVQTYPEVIDLDAPPTQKSLPYPVGMFQTVGGKPRFCPSPPPEMPPTFTTPAMKKQSYTVVQTGNPSKLLISTKAKVAEQLEVPKKRSKKNSDAKDSSSKEPFRVTLEDVEQPKDAGFFTFINVDPLLQPSYVLPTANIIQESQISTSTVVDREAEKTKENQKEENKYSCNMCGAHFSREKKLLAHIQSHYTKMDEEDQRRSEHQPPKRKGKRH